MTCEHYALERFNTYTDHPDWELTGEIYRTRQAAEAAAAERNDHELRHRNLQASHRHKEAVAAFREHQALVVAGLRGKANGPKDPGTLVPITELGRWDERYRAVPVEFEDD